MAKNYYNQPNTSTYGFDANAAYDLSRFQATHSAAPAKKAQPRILPKLELVDQPVAKSKNQLRREERQGLMKSMKVILISALLFGLLGTMIYGETQKNQLTREISKTQTQLNVAKSESTRLNMMLNSIVSLDNIEQYATEKLGMVKAQNQQISYINIAQETADKKAAEEKAAQDKAQQEAQDKKLSKESEKSTGESEAEAGENGALSAQISNN